MRKSIALLVAILLVLPMLSVATPVRASTGAQLFAIWDGSDLTIAAYNVTIKAGDSAVVKADGVLTTGTFAMIFSINGSLESPVKFAGAGFDLYISKDYYSRLSADDKMYAAGFSKADVYTPGLKTVNVSNSILKNGWGIFEIGTVPSDGSTYGILTGPIPFDITSDYKYIKVFDGSTDQVAVAGILEILPSFNLVPSSGPGGQQVCLSAVALAPNTLYNITYANATTAAAQVMSGADGKFNFCWNIKDLCKAYDGPYDFNETIYIDIWKNSTSAFVDEVEFTEMYRVLTQITTPSGNWFGPYGNYSSSYELYDVEIFVTKNLTIAGDWFNPTGPVDVYIGNILVGSATPKANGTFKITVTVPVLPMGPVNITLNNAGCKFIFTAEVMPTLIVTPEVGPIGTTVNFTAYGFPKNSEVTLWWWVNYACNFDCEWIAIMNATVDSTGQFNSTTTYVVPKQFGGPHPIVATEGTEHNCTSYDPDDIFGGIAFTVFTVTPTLVITPSTFDLDGTTFWINGSGFDPLLAYAINIDNQAYAVPTAGYMWADWWWGLEIYYPYYPYIPENGYGNGWYWDILHPQGWIGNPAGHFVISDECGDIAIQLVKAGFQPGLHSVALTAANFNDYWYYWHYWDDWGDKFPWWHEDWLMPATGGYEGLAWKVGYYPTDIYATFTVTAVGNPIVDSIVQNITSQLTSLNAKIVSIQGDIATLQTDIGTLKVSVNSLDAKVTALQGSVATVSTNLGTLTGTVTSIAGDMATVKTQVGTINANVAAMKPFLPVDMMPVWIAVIFAIIAAIASIYGVLVIRSKIAQ